MIRIGDNIEIPCGKSLFPDHTLLLKLDPWSVKTKSYNIVIEWLYEGDSELFTLICVKRHLEQYYPYGTFTLDMPYIPHARMDRVKSEGDVFTLKYFCEVINSLNFSEVRVRDAHSNVSLALLDNVSQESINNYIHRAILDSGAEALFFPDEGAMKRYSEHATIPYAFGMKKRDWETGKILGLDIINGDAVKGKNILIVDDICSRGGTFYYSAKALKEAGAANISLYVTHLEGTVMIGDLPTSNLIKHIYTTESIFPESELNRNYIDGFSWKDWITVYLPTGGKIE
jgi:ribose-phosphate pyrophosphokinase